MHVLQFWNESLPDPAIHVLAALWDGITHTPFLHKDQEAWYAMQIGVRHAFLFSAALQALVCSFLLHRSIRIMIQPLDIDAE